MSRVAQHKPNKTLTKKKREFCEEYVLTGNGTRSYMKAFGKTEEEYKLCSVEANRLLKKEEVINYIADLTKQKNPLLTQEWLCDRLLEIINNPESKEQDRLKAIDMLLKSLGAYTTNQNINAKVEGNLETVIKVTIEEDDSDE